MNIKQWGMRAVPHVTWRVENGSILDTSGKAKLQRSLWRNERLCSVCSWRMNSDRVEDVKVHSTFDQEWGHILVGGMSELLWGEGCRGENAHRLHPVRVGLEALKCHNFVQKPTGWHSMFLNSKVT